MSKIASVEDVKAKLVIDLQDFVGEDGDALNKPHFVEVICEEHSLEIVVYDMAEIKKMVAANEDEAAANPELEADADFDLEDFSETELASVYVVEYVKRNFYTNAELFESFSANSYAEVIEELKHLL